MQTIIIKIAVAMCVLSAPLFADKIAITNVLALTMDGEEAIANATVIIDGDRIMSVTAAGDVPGGAEVIDGRGKVLIPGLTEMHGHLPNAGPTSETTRETLFLYLAGGVTTVRGMLGNPVQFTLRDMIAAGDLDGPTLYLAAPSLNGNTVSSPEDGRRKIRQYASEGWDLQKIHPGLTRAEYDAIADEAALRNFPIGGHVPADVGIVRALEAGQASIDHMDGYIAWLGGGNRDFTATDLARAAEMTRRSGTWIVPTQALFNLLRSGGDLDVLMARPENKYISNATMAQWEAAARRLTTAGNPRVAENRQKLLKAFADGGVNLALGSDAPQIFSVPGFSIWREVEVMLEAGLKPGQILAMGTRAPGVYFMDKDMFGMIKAGYRADLVLLDRDPRTDATALFEQSLVMAAGRPYTRADIDARLALIAARHR